ncbi:MAG: hypothetical protein ACOH5I_06415 [Oligoflexus sp.]
MSSTMEPADLCDFLRDLDVSTILIEPKPKRDLLEKMFQSCQSVDCDHGLVNFRFVVVENEARELFGAALVEAVPDLDEQSAYRLKSLAFEAPQQIVLIIRLRNETIGLGTETLVVLQKAFSFVHSLRLLAKIQGFSTKWVAFNGLTDGLMSKLFHLERGESIVGWLDIGSDALNQNRLRSIRHYTQRLNFLEHR